MGNAFYYNWEINLILWLQTNITPIGITIASLASFLADKNYIGMIILIVYYCLDKETGIFTLKNLALGMAINPMIKSIISRRRPYFDNTAIKCLSPVSRRASIYSITAQGYSFPSGHATNASAAYLSLAYKSKRPLVISLMVIMTFIVCISRIILGVHYPTDVICGVILGLIIIMAHKIIQRIAQEKQLIQNLLIIILCIWGLMYVRTADYYSGLGILLGVVLGNCYEDKYVKFANVPKIGTKILRAIIGIALYNILSGLCGLVFKSTMAWQLYYIIRYCIIYFILVGIYPLSFKYIDSIHLKS